MKRLPKYIHKKIDDAIVKAKKDTKDYWNDWEIDVSHWGSPDNHVSYWGKNKENALECIPATYSHNTKVEHAHLHSDKYGDIQDSDYIVEIEMTKP